MTRTVTTLPVTEKNVGSGNWDTTRAPIDRIIIHTMVGTTASASSHFYNPTSKVSAHYGVSLDGSITHWVDEDNTAYHSGNYAMNQRSIGIEHEDNGDYNGVRTDALYTTAAKLIKDICSFYNIPLDREHILRHNQIVATGCPAALDIDRIIREASGVINPTVSLQQDLDACRLARDTHDRELKRICEALKVTQNIDIIMVEIEKLLKLEEIVRQKDASISAQAKEIEDSKKEIVDLGVQISELSKINVEALSQNAKEKIAREKDATIIESLKTRLDQLQKIDPIDKITGWDLMVMGWKKFWKGDK